jgi:imidazolonepropionase
MHKEKQTLVGPFKQILPMTGLRNKGALKDELLTIIEDGGILIQGDTILAVDNYRKLLEQYPNCEVESLNGDLVALPGFIDAHTHICFAGTRSFDYAARNNGKTYLEISKEGGGIWSTVKQTRAASKEELVELMIPRMQKQISNGITTTEVKSGYGLNTENELKMLKAIKDADNSHPLDLIPTCLAAHIIPKENGISEKEYLQLILEEIEPQIAEEKLCSRFDIFIEDGAFTEESSMDYLNQLKAKGYELTVHGDQFNAGGSKVAIAVGAKSVDHLEASGDEEINALANSEVIPVALPGATIGLGCDFTPARQLLDKGCSLAIASDWNPGSAPQGNLLSQADILGTFQKLSTSEIFSGITFRAANALGLSDRGKLESKLKADIVAFPCHDYKEILYHQGELKPIHVWKNGIRAI